MAFKNPIPSPFSVRPETFTAFNKSVELGYSVTTSLTLVDGSAIGAPPILRE